MKALRVLWSRLRGIFANRAADDDLGAELQAHLDMETAEYIRRGMAPEEARRRALISSGGLTQAAVMGKGVPATISSPLALKPAPCA